jgi:hypothetical protein
LQPGTARQDFIVCVNEAFGGDWRKVFLTVGKYFFLPAFFHALLLLHFYSFLFIFIHIIVASCLFSHSIETSRAMVAKLSMYNLGIKQCH